MCVHFKKSVLSHYFKFLNYSIQALEAKIQELQNSSVLRNCDAFLLLFMGFGDYGGRMFDCRGQPVSIKTDILQHFNTENCPDLEAKPKIFCFQMAKPGLIFLESSY